MSYPPDPGYQYPPPGGQYPPQPPPGGPPQPPPGGQYPPPADPYQPTPQPDWGQPASPYQPTSPGYGQQPPYQPASPAPYQPASPAPYQPASPQPYQQAGPYPQGPYQPDPYGGGYGGYPPGPPPRRRGRGLLILAVVLAAVLVLGGGVGVAAFLLTRDTDRGGPETPVAAVQAFMQAVYRDQDPAAASALVCSEARDQAALGEKVNEIAAYGQSYSDPRFTWSSPRVVEQRDPLVIVATTVTMVTGDEKTADLGLRISVLDKDPEGWWVCNLETEPAPTDPVPGGQDEGEDPGGEGEEDADGDSS